jgi:hypothetical protein
LLVLSALALLRGDIDWSARREGLGHQIAAIQIETTLSSHAFFQRLECLEDRL